MAYNIETSHSVIETIGLAFGILYMLGFSHYIYKRYLLTSFQAIINMLDDKENDSISRPIVYSLLNCIPFLILQFFSTFNSETTLGISVIIGSDTFTIICLMGLILWYYPKQNHGIIDPWSSLRDTFVYAISLIMVFVYLVANIAELYMSLPLVGSFGLNYYMLFYSDEIRDKLLDWLELETDDADYDCEIQYTFKKRRFSSTELKEQNCIDKQSINLLKKINRSEVQLTMQFGQQEPLKKKYRAILARWVYILLFAIKNHNQKEKEDRTARYEVLYKPKEPQKSSARKKTQLIKRYSKAALEEEQKLLALQKQHEDDQAQSPIYEHESEVSVSQIQISKPKLSPEKEDNKIIWYLFLPVHLLLHLQPNYFQNPTIKKLILCIFVNVCLLTGIFFMIDWWTFGLWEATTIPLQIYGIGIGVLMSIEMGYSNMELAQKEKELLFLQIFFQCAICKSSICIGLPILIRCLVTLSTDVYTIQENQTGFALSIAVYAFFMAIFGFQAYLKRFKLQGEDGKFLLGLYSLWVIVALVLTSIISSL